jgi:hypothetical protein
MYNDLDDGKRNIIKFLEKNFEVWNIETYYFQFFVIGSIDCKLVRFKLMGFATPKVMKN